MQPRMAATDRRQPAKRDREPLERLERGVELPLAVATDVQARPYASVGGRLMGVVGLILATAAIAWVPTDRIHALPCRSNHGLLRTSPTMPAPATPPGCLFIRSSHNGRISPPVEWRRQDDRFVAGLFPDDLERALELRVVQRKIGDVVTRVTIAARPPALAQVEGVERMTRVRRRTPRARSGRSSH